LKPLEIPADYSGKKLGIKLLSWEYSWSVWSSDQSINGIVIAISIEICSLIHFSWKSHTLILQKKGKLVFIGKTPHFTSSFMISY